MDFVAGFVTDGQQFLKRDDGLGLVGEISIWSFIHALEGKLEGAESGGRGTDCRRGKWQAGENLGFRFWFVSPICGLVFCSVRFGCGKVFGGGWASGPWIFDGGAGGFFPRTGSGLMDFVAGFVTEGFQFLLEW
jgi:hypothetical protein